ncbi:hypothetical protein BBO99_00002641 [Phytophthora kernoviae]|uniref:Uncharacterized protein n=2 Tax=Phytophthora kernoviae TaxID=325452 RepID=A0A3R7NJS8_9STRA|nr:hypothetical protein G195_004561 [Phytophthora kernoviae 00238/432]KAG2526941.1 hypothetical protein JM16_002773 [Phytophthora kernoviae]KAG2528452.1 hypothetical protein JM18_002615 [Phytophthora kernoviae]RLN14148.1 hypothetical protein BBI17_002585 [Phytophthora kernoviae]RLN82771.1 hypothetical protein BBO99_00002641 [Phytophthora kernoviae]
MSDHKSIPSRTFMGSTILPPVAFSDDYAIMYRSVTDESFPETRSLDTGANTATNVAVASAFSMSSSDTIADDALLIGPGSYLSAATKILVVVCTGTVQGTLGDVMYGVFTHDSKPLQRRSIYTKDGMEDLVMLATVESPTEENSFDFLGATWFLYSAGLRVIIKQHDYVLL